MTHYVVFRGELMVVSWWLVVLSDNGNDSRRFLRCAAE
jgi:hypothetical protein